jgi:hypothetical protein
MFLIFSVTFVGSNAKISESSKSGFFTVIAILGVLGIVLSFILS